MQKEIDALTGGERLPTLSDRDKLPYLSCVIKESLRVYPIAAIGMSVSFEIELARTQFCAVSASSPELEG